MMSNNSESFIPLVFVPKTLTPDIIEQAVLTETVFALGDQENIDHVVHEASRLMGHICRKSMILETVQDPEYPGIAVKIADRNKIPDDLAEGF